MIRPPDLKPGDVIGLVAPARKVTPGEMAPAIEILTRWGFKVKTGRNLYRVFHQFAGTDHERAADLQSMIEAPEVKAILCARGGYGCLRTLRLCDTRPLQRQPKWLIGFSDITVLHACLNHQLGLESLHAMMAINMKEGQGADPALLSLKNALCGGPLRYDLPPHLLNKVGEATGKLVGGNLSILYSLRGTDLDFPSDGNILFLEDLDEYLYHVDRMMLNLHFGGKLDGLAGVVVGALSDMRDNTIPYGKSARDIVSEHLQSLKIPVLFDFPAGHISANHCLVMGRTARLKVGAGGGELVFSE